MAEFEKPVAQNCSYTYFQEARARFFLSIFIADVVLFLSERVTLLYAK
jgi:hypothetical protein